jgi:hypothetical protein
MSIKSLARQWLNSRGYAVYNTAQPHVYSEDGFSTTHNKNFLRNLRFLDAYERGIKANGGADHHMRWRAHVAFWVARQACRLPGDFVECGVSTGFLASGIMDYLNWNSLGRRYVMFDTWAGLDDRYLSDAEREAGRLEWYAGLDFESVKRNFSEYENVEMVRGTVPETLASTKIDQVCYLSLDMNCTRPEIEAAEYFWPRMVPGAFMLLDDYAYSGYEEQNAAFNEFATRHEIEILSLPTGQGLAIKP